MYRVDSNGGVYVNGYGIDVLSYGSSPVVEYVGSYHVVVSGIVGGSSLVSRDSYGKDNSPSSNNDNGAFNVDQGGTVDIGYYWNTDNSYGK